MTASVGRLLDVGWVHPGGRTLASADGGGVRVQPELAIVLAGRPKLPATLAGVLAATQAVLLVITVAGADGDVKAVILGSVAADPRDLVDLRLIGCVVRVDGEVVATGAGAAAALGHPAASAASVINRETVEASEISAGAIVLTGALTDPVPVHPGAVVSAEFDGLGAAELQL